ncbi:hypothetical protein L6279_04935 [Candidatus Parcubacteria bacterium]|nr:hypothetical protein [Candidatus Parcubacteria bacterium]
MDADTKVQVEQWEEFYQKVFGIEVDFSELHIPEKQEGFDRLIIVAQGIIAQNAYDKCSELFLCQKWSDDLIRKWSDTMVETGSERDATNGVYAVWVRDRVEADEELCRFSFDDLKEHGIPGITLEERLLYELKYFNETGEHLDRESITLCSGSHIIYLVPIVRWYKYEQSDDGGLEVDDFSPGRRFRRIRARQVVC